MFATIFLLIQLAPIQRTSKKATNEIVGATPIREIVKRSYDAAWQLLVHPPLSQAHRSRPVHSK